MKVVCKECKKVGTTKPRQLRQYNKTPEEYMCRSCTRKKFAKETKGRKQNLTAQKKLKKLARIYAREKKKKQQTVFDMMYKKHVEFNR